MSFSLKDKNEREQRYRGSYRKGKKDENCDGNFHSDIVSSVTRCWIKKVAQLFSKVA